jgi:hypothetical protein
MFKQDLEKYHRSSILVFVTLSRACRLTGHISGKIINY